MENNVDNIELVNPTDSPDGNQISRKHSGSTDNNGNQEVVTKPDVTERLALTEANISLRVRSSQQNRDRGENNEAFSDEECTLRSSTDRIPTDTVGKIRFLNISTYDQSLREYVRLDINETKDSDFVNFLQKDWKLKKPSLLIAIAGGSESEEFPRREEYFRGIVNAAVSTDAWIITCGINSGVSQDIGHAARNHRHATGDEFIVIGIADWNSIRKDHREKLQRNDPDEIRKAQDVMERAKNQSRWLDLDEELGSLASYLGPVELSLNGDEFDLEPNHTHYVLVDTLDTDNNDGIKFRVQLVRAISEWADIDDDVDKQGEMIPLVYIAIDGGQDSLNAADEAVENDIPFIAIAQSTSTDSKILKQIFSTRKPHLLNITNNGGTDMDQAIINALKRGAKGSPGDHNVAALMLALKLDRIDMIEESEVRQMILQDVNGHSEALHYAFIHNRTEFVKLILGLEKVKLKEYLTAPRLEQLYNSQGQDSLLVKLLNETNKLKKCENDFNLVHVDRVIKRLTGDVIRFRHSMLLSDHNGSIQKLFIYSILNNFDEMADYFWSRCSDAISAALVASKMYTSLASLKFTSAEWREGVRQNSRKYEDWAYDILTSCGENPGRSDPSDLLIRVLPQWGNITCLNIADTADDIRFMSHCVVEKLLHQKWHGRIKRDDVIKTDSVKSALQPLWLTMCSLLPFLIPYLVRFRESKGNQRYLYWFQIWWFYASPDTIFRNSMIFYVIFLFLFSYNLIWEDVYIPLSQATFLDWLLMFWVASMIMEEIRQIAEWEAHSVFLQVTGWWADPWNQLDSLAVVAFITGSYLRFKTDDDLERAENLADAARIILAIDLFIFYIRFLEYLTMIKSIGPKVLMIGRMFIDLGFFMCILFIILLGYGVSVHVVLYPHVKEPVSTVFQSIFFRSYFQIYGELFLENIQATPSDGSCTYNISAINQGEEPCALHPEIGVFLLAVYLLLSNVLLLNLLIAMFSNTFSLVQEQTDLHWRFQRYSLTREYVEKPMLVPPLCIVSPIARFVRHFVLKGQLGGSYRFAMRCEFDENKTNMLTLFEDTQARQYIKNISTKEETEQLNERVSRLETMLEEQLAELISRSGRNEKSSIDESTA